MNRMMLVWATVAAAVVGAGCATSETPSAMRRDSPPAPAPAPAPAPVPVPAACGGSVTEVRISGVTMVSATQATIQVPARTQITMSKGGANWAIATAGYVFAPAGVVIAMPPGPGTSYRNGANQFGWCFETSAEWASKYTVYFQAAAYPNVTWKCDPMIANYGGEATPFAAETVNCSLVPVVR